MKKKFASQIKFGIHFTLDVVVSAVALVFVLAEMIQNIFLVLE